MSDTHSPMGVTQPSRAKESAPTGLRARIRRAMKLRRDYHHLAGLPDYLLDDIGVTRADLRDPHRRIF